MTYTEKELDQFLHGISLSLLSKKSAQHWRYDEETAKEIEWLEVLERKVRADKADRKTESNSEIPNNCEHITEDGVTCAKYPACDDCLDNPLNKVKGSERLVKGSEQTEPTISKMEQVDKDINVRSKDEPQSVTYNPTSVNNIWEKPTNPYVPNEQTEPTISKMEQVETMSCQECRHYMGEYECEPARNNVCAYEPKDEPQTDCPWRETK